MVPDWCCTPVFIGIYSYIRLRLKSLEEDKKQLEAEVQKRTVEISSQNKVLEAQKEEIQSSIHYAGGSSRPPPRKQA